MADPRKIPPHSREAEMAVLGSIMIDRNAMMRVLDTLSPDDFYFSEHGIIYRAMMDLFEKSAPLDILSVQGILSERDKLEQIGNASYLTALVSEVVSPGSVAHYAEVVKNK